MDRNCRVHDRHRAREPQEQTTVSLLVKSRKIVVGVALFALASAGCYPSSFHGYTVVPDVSNFWHQPTRTIHVAPGQSERVLYHEACHGMQGATLPTDDVDLSGWYFTPEGLDFRGTIEQAADICAYTLMGVEYDENTSQFDYLTYIDPTWEAWAERWVP